MRRPVLGEIDFRKDKFFHLQSLRIEGARTVEHDNRDWKRNYGQTSVTCWHEGGQFVSG